MSDLLSSLVSLIPGLISDFSGSTSAPYLKQQQQLAAQQQQLAGALSDTNNPMYKNLYSQYQQQGAQNMAQSLAEAQGQNRLASGMGRTPLFSQDRGGETLFRSLMQGYQGLGNQADQQTRSALTNAMSGGNTALNAYDNISGYGKSANAQQLSGFDSIANLLKQHNQTPQASNANMNQMPSMYGNGSYPTMNNQSTQGINWGQQPPDKYNPQLNTGGYLSGYGGY